MRYKAAQEVAGTATDNLALMWCCSNRHSFIWDLTGLSFDKTIRWHRWSGRAAIFQMGFHGLLMYWYYYTLIEVQHIHEDADEREFKTFYDAVTDGILQKNGSGAIAFAFSAILFLSSISFLRRFSFLTFLSLHWIFLLFFLVFSILHDLSTLQTLFIPLCIWIIDLRWRWKSIHIDTSLVSLTPLPGGVVRFELQREKKWSYEAGQYVFLCVPELGLTEWHPFSISSSPQQNMLVLHARALGSWSKRLMVLALRNALQEREKLEQKQRQQKNEEVAEDGEVLHQLHLSPAASSFTPSSTPSSSSSPSALPPLHCYVEGPYGSLSLPLPSYSYIIMFSGGIGITPLQSIFNDLVLKDRERKEKENEGAREKENEPGKEQGTVFKGVELKRLQFIWAVREVELVQALYGETQMLHIPSHSPSVDPAPSSSTTSFHQSVPSPSQANPESNNNKFEVEMKEFDDEVHHDEEEDFEEDVMINMEEDANVAEDGAIVVSATSSSSNHPSSRRLPPSKSANSSTFEHFADPDAGASLSSPASRSPVASSPLPPYFTPDLLLAHSNSKTGVIRTSFYLTHHKPEAPARSAASSHVGSQTNSKGPAASSTSSSSTTSAPSNPTASASLSSSLLRSRYGELLHFGRPSVLNAVYEMKNFAIRSENEQRKEESQEEEQVGLAEENREGAGEEGEQEEKGVEERVAEVRLSVRQKGDQSEKTNHNRSSSGLTSRSSSRVSPFSSSLSSSAGDVGIDFGDVIRVALLVCGPAGMMAEARRACAIMSDKRIRFDLHEETFEL